MKRVARIAGVLIVGALIFEVGSTELARLMQPEDFVPALRKALAISRDSPEWPEILRKLHHAGDVNAYVVYPLTGLIVGVFVGLVQRERAMVVALSCIVPNFLLGLFSDHTLNWAGSPSGIFHYLADSSLPFIAAVAGAAFAQWLIRYISRNPKPMGA